jgi:hypothetical protein
VGRASLITIAAVVALAGCGSGTPIHAANPRGYPVECPGAKTTVCYQLGRRVLFNAGMNSSCNAFGISATGQRDWQWVALSDPAPGAPPTALTYVCGRPTIGLGRS